MRLWTIQGIEIYEQLKRDKITYCTKPVWVDEDNFMYAYHWMAKQMRKRIGEPPVDGIEYPCTKGISILLTLKVNILGYISFIELEI